jgi:Asp-tRNA(Asn)/Glu-tRNA(Gln) amidotransferase A subunit family amidase
LPIASQSQGFEVVEAEISGIHAAFRARTLTCRALVQSYLDRIEAYDKQGPAVNSLVVVHPRALEIADSLDQRFASGSPTGPLHCVPVIVKDNFETYDLQTTAGSLSLAGWIPSQDATMVRRIRQAGAVILAKSNMAEWAFTPYETVSSILPGYTKNPYALDRVTAGSSGGTGAAVSASFGTVGLGTDTGNSIRGPSSHTALVGIRSTMGLTSRAGVVPLFSGADIAGPMARTVSDAVAVFNVIVGEDPADSATIGYGERAEGDYLQFLRRGALNGARIGILRQAFERQTTDAEVVRVFEASVAAMRAAGATIVDPAGVDSLNTLLRGASCNTFRHDLERYFRERGQNAPVGTITGILRSGDYHPTVRQQLQNAQTDTVPPAEKCPNVAFARARFGAAVTMMMDSLRLDALVHPTWSNPPRLIGDLNTPHGDNSQVFSPRSGFPAITVPMGYTRDNRLPAGITFFGRAWNEGPLFALAYDFEQLTKHRRPPASTPALRR